MTHAGTDAVEALKLLRGEIPRSDTGSLATRSSLLRRAGDPSDEAGWTEFFDTYWFLIFNAARRAGLQETEAQDVVQEVMLRLWKQLPEFRYDRGKGSFKGWVLRTTSWEIQTHLRRRARAPLATDPGDPLMSAANADDPDEVLARIWDEEWRRNLIGVALERVREAVNPLHYQAFELYVLKERKPAEVARALGLSAAHVYLVAHRIRKRLQTELHHLEETA